MNKKASIPKSLARRYYRPAEAATELGVDAETIRQAVLRFDKDGNRIPLYYALTGALRAVWASREHMEQAHERGTPNKGHISTSSTDGKAEWWDITNGEPGLLLSREVSLGTGLWLELDPMHAHDLAADPAQEGELRWFVSPPYQLGPMPSCAVIQSFATQPQAKFADCWISANDVEAIRSGAPSDPKSLDTRERITLLAIIRALAALADYDLAQPYSGEKEGTGIADIIATKIQGIGLRTIERRRVADWLKAARDLSSE